MKKSEETIVRQRHPITKELYVTMAKLAEESLPDLAESVLFKFFIIKVVGFRVAEPRRQESTSSNMHRE